MFAWIPLFPLAGVLINGLLGIKYLSRRTVQAVAVGAVGLSFAASVLSFVRLAGGGPSAVVKSFGTWVPASLVRVFGGRLEPFSVEFAFRYDSLAAVMTLVVTGVGLLIHIYSIGYMAKDRSIARFFAYLNLFTFAMLILVLGANLAVMFIGWEGVGLCSYLLIGFWFSREAAANAGKKAFITNRVGDFGFLLGIGLIISALGTVDIGQISSAVGNGQLGRGTATAAALLLFLGATGKSAQIPLYTWLPDAMEGPTPVSALIHAATMVTAGVYMVARMHVLYSFSGTALTVVAVVGSLTAVYAATMALVQHDIKRVLAYSTISQIGYMFAGLGVGAYAAGIFHLVTHAFFKSLLFLAAGSVIHALSGEQDMRKMGGLAARLPRTRLVFVVGALAIAGIPGLSGFFSKDEILASAFASGHYAVGIFCLAVTALTALYMFRLIFLTFGGRERSDSEVRLHLHESPRVMMVPLQILAVLSAVGGYVGLPHVLGGGNWLGKFLASSTGAPESTPTPGMEIFLMLLSAGLAVAGIYGAYVIYVKKEGKPARRLAERFQALYRVVLHNYYVDEFYGKAIVGGTLGLGRLSAWFDTHIVDGLVNGSARLVRGTSRFSMLVDDKIIDGAVNGLGRTNLSFSRGLTRLQSGSLNTYALAIVIGLVALISVAVAVF